MKNIIMAMLITLLISNNLFAYNVNDKKSFVTAVMAPLEVEKFKDFDAHLDYVFSAGVDAVSVDVWWGLVDNENDYIHWKKHYTDVFDRIERKGLKIIPIISFHQCGGGPNDTCDIPLKPWLWNKVKVAYGLPSVEAAKYESASGEAQGDYIPQWYTDSEIFEKQSADAVLSLMVAYMEKFKTTFSKFSSSMVEINLSLGPTGEMRLPVYNESDGWNFPEVGKLQVYSKSARRSFRESMRRKYNGSIAQVNAKWGTQLSNFDAIQPPGGDKLVYSDRIDESNSFFTSQGYRGKYGNDFTTWQQDVLLNHAQRLIAAADKVFDGEFSGIPFGVKIPGLHWQQRCTNTPRATEVAAGLLNTQEGSLTEGKGYEIFFRMIKSIQQKINRNIVVHFTALEMDNDSNYCQHCDKEYENCTSLAEDLVLWVANAAHNVGDITLRGENALPGINCDDEPGDIRTWGQIHKAFNRSKVYSGFTLLRMENWGYTNEKCTVSEGHKCYLFIQEFDTIKE